MKTKGLAEQTDKVPMKNLIAFSLMTLSLVIGCSSSPQTARVPASPDKVATRDNTICGLNQDSLQDKIKDCERFSTPGSDLILIFSNEIGTEYLLDKKTKLIWMNNSYDRRVDEHQAAHECVPYMERYPRDEIMRGKILMNLQTRLPTLEEVLSLKQRGLSNELTMSDWVWTSSFGGRGLQQQVFFSSRRSKTVPLKGDVREDGSSASYRCVAPYP